MVHFNRLYWILLFYKRVKILLSNIMLYWPLAKDTVSMNLFVLTTFHVLIYHLGFSKGGTLSIKIEK